MPAMNLEFLSGRVVVKFGDITEECTDAIVNAANSTLLGGGGVDGAIHRRGGTEILEACKKIRNEIFPDGLPTGEAVITPAGNLSCKFVIHTVGPIYGRHDGDESHLLRRCYQNSLRIAVENDVKTISFPSISTGAYSFPKSEAASVSSLAICDFLSQTNAIEKVHLIFFSSRDAENFVEFQNF
jgi:O-acetyl-ADP-ribose deacetylase (regulator of RNase III)